MIHRQKPGMSIKALQKKKMLLGDMSTN